MRFKKTIASILGLAIGLSLAPAAHADTVKEFDYTGMELSSGNPGYFEVGLDQNTEFRNQTLSAIKKLRQEALNDAEIKWPHGSNTTLRQYLANNHISETTYLNPKWDEDLEYIAIQKSAEETGHLYNSYYDISRNGQKVYGSSSGTFIDYIDYTKIPVADVINYSIDRDKEKYKHDHDPNSHYSDYSALINPNNTRTALGYTYNASFDPKLCLETEDEAKAEEEARLKRDIPGFTPGAWATGCTDYDSTRPRHIWSLAIASGQPRAISHPLRDFQGKYLMKKPLGDYVEAHIDVNTVSIDEAITPKVRNKGIPFNTGLAAIDGSPLPAGRFFFKGTWSSADEAIVKVVNNKLVGVSAGTTEVTLTLENGKKFKFPMKVTPTSATSYEALADVETVRGMKPELPKTVNITWSNGKITTETATWPAITDTQLQNIGEFEVSTTVKGLNIKAKVKVLKQMAKVLDKDANKLEGHNGEKITIKGYGFTPGANVLFELHSDPIKLGTAVADTSGIATLETTIPAAAAVGEHKVILTELNAKGEKTETVATAKLKVLEKGKQSGNTSGNSTSANNNTPGNSASASSKPVIGKDNNALAQTGSSSTVALLAALSLLAAGSLITYRRKNS